MKKEEMIYQVINQVISQIIEHLSQELSNSEQAAQNAHLAATDDQSVAETQYDTLAIESAYLAEGQSRRIIEFKKALQACERLMHQHKKPVTVNNVHLVSLGSLVQLAEDEAKQHWFFIAPAAAGFRTEIAEQQITVITPQSPMGQALLGKQCDDDINIVLGTQIVSDLIVQVFSFA